MMTHEDQDPIAQTEASTFRRLVETWETVIPFKPGAPIPYANLTANLRSLTDHPDPNIREYAAQKGYGLEKLVDDEVAYVRAAVAKRGYGLDKLVDDEAPEVRFVVAKQGYGLDKLARDKDPYVRGLALAIIEHRYRFPSLKNIGRSIIRTSRELSSVFRARRKARRIASKEVR